MMRRFFALFLLFFCPSLFAMDAARLQLAPDRRRHRVGDDGRARRGQGPALRPRAGRGPERRQ